MKNIDISAIFGVLILPMRNWNLDQMAQYPFGDYVLILPMRNWNIRFSIVSADGSVVLILPMRNWNLHASIRKKSLAPRFDLTYEELEHLLTTSTAQCSQICFDLTYEELEPRRRPLLYSLAFRFDLTYEELEHVIYEYRSRFKQRFDLTYEELKQYNLITIA